MPDPLVSVVVPAYRHAAFVETCLRSIAGQDYPAKQIVVIDDGSDDGTADIVERVGRELGLEWRRAPHRGLMPTLQEMLSLACGKYYVSMGSDDVMVPGRLRFQVDFLESHPHCVGCSGQALALHPDGALTPMKQYLRGIPEVSFEDLFLARKELHTVSVMWRRQEFLDVGGYDMDQSVEDLPIWLRLTRRFGPIAVLPEVLTHYRIHGANLHMQTERVYSAFLGALESHRDHPRYAEALAAWKANWFSELAQTNRREALRRLPELATWSVPFLRRLPKLLLPRKALRWWLR
jgi:alpha-1,3-rhamnosyltransferase